MRFYGNPSQEAKRNLAKGLYDVANRDFHLYFDYRVTDTLVTSGIKILFLIEPEVVNPFQYQKEILDVFDLVIPYGQERATRLNLGQYLHNPYDVVSPKTSPFNGRSKSFVLMNSNKYSAISGSLYGLRRKVIAGFEEHNLDLRLYGFDWDAAISWRIQKQSIAIRDCLKSGRVPHLLEVFQNSFKKFRCFRGFTGEKQNTLSISSYSIVIENQPDYVSEKLFDSILAGCVPIYVGPTFDETLQQLERMIIRAEPTVESIMHICKNLDEETVEQKREAIASLSADLAEWQDFSNDKVWDNATKMIIDYFDLRKN
jgi:hypothetical protein